MAESKKSKAPGKEPNPSRRSFLSKIWMALGAIVCFEFIGLIFAFLRPHKIKSKASNSNATITAGPVNNFAPDSVTAFIAGRFYLSRLQDGGFLALSRQCTHLGCTVPWIASEKEFVCPCHSSAFDNRGVVIRAPAPRPLDIHPVIIENHIVKVDTDKRIKRSEFRAEQVTYPNKQA